MMPIQPSARARRGRPIGHRNPGRRPGRNVGGRAMCDANHPEHVFARSFGFYRAQLWWIDSFTIRHGHYYRFHVAGTNGMRDDESISWSVPNLRGAYAFRLKVIA
jgi:hypothetical protein